MNQEPWKPLTVKAAEQSGNPILQAYADVYTWMKARVGARTGRAYKIYGERSIEIWPGWQGELGFDRFATYLIMELGERPGPGSEWSIDRIDNDGDYRPGNIRWADHSTQMRNRRVWGCKVVYQGESMSLPEASRRSGINYWTLYRRLRSERGKANLFAPLDLRKYRK